MTHWTARNSRDASHEGWDLFLGFGDTRISLQAVRAEQIYPDDCARVVFSDHDEAREFVWRQAYEKGARLHIKAMRILLVRNPREFRAIERLVERQMACTR